MTPEIQIERQIDVDRLRLRLRGMTDATAPIREGCEKQFDIVEIEDNGCTCGECVSCKLRGFVRRAEEEAKGFD